MDGRGINARTLTILAALGAAVVVFLAVLALGIGKSSGGTVHASAGSPQPRYVTFSLEAPHVQSGYSDYAVGSQGALTPEQPTSLATLPASAFVRPIDRYRAYAVAQLTHVQADLRGLQRALTDGDRAGAELAWSASFASYLHLGAVYLTGQLARLNEQIDGTPGGLPGGVANPSFQGLHRIEYGLWTGSSLASLVPATRRLEAAVGTLRALLAHVSITPLEYVTRAHEILEDAQRDLLSGTQVPWSGAGVLGTAAGLSATEEVIATLHPYLFEEDGEEQPVGPALETELASLRATLRSIAAAHGGVLPRNSELTAAQAELLDGALGGALEALSQVPGALESEPLSPTPKIPASAERIDP